MAIELPFQAVPHEIAWRKSGASRTGGPAITGGQQVVRSDAGFWLADMEIMVRGEHRTLAWRAFMASLDGMAGEVLVPLTTAWRPVDGNGRRLGVAGAATMGGGVLADNVGFGQTETPVMWAAADTAAGGTRLRVNHPGVTGLRPGHYFGIGERLYLVSRAWQESVEHADITGGGYTFGTDPYTFDGDPYTFGEAVTVRVGTNVQVLDFWPRLRDPVAAGAPLILGRPVCRMRLASDDTGALSEAWRLARGVSVSFMEVL